MQTIEPARRGDLPEILALLRANDLPTDGVAEHVDGLIVARAGRTILGIAGLEWYEDGTLLRSVAVEATVRGTGLGQRLTDTVVTEAERGGAPAVYLLTTTADKFFGRFGFERIDRAEVPASVQDSVEFRFACPSTAIVMRKILGGGVNSESRT